MDLQQDLGVWFIDIDGQVKTEESRRVVPVHDLLIDLGFQRYREALIAAGHDRLFPDLKANSMDKLTKEASRLANRYIDKHVSEDPRLVFHSFRHKFKDLAVTPAFQTRSPTRFAAMRPRRSAAATARAPRSA